MTEKKTGRPPRYTEAQVLKGIEIVEGQGDTPTGDTVKKAMCAELGVPGGINAQSLEKEVERLLEERERARRDRLIAAMPAGSRHAVKDVAALVEAAVLDHLAEQHDTLRSFADSKTEELKIDLVNYRKQIRELIDRIDEKDSEIAELEAEKHDANRRLDAAAFDIAKLKERIGTFEQEEDFRTKMLAMMKETLGQPVGPAG